MKDRVSRHRAGGRAARKELRKAARKGGKVVRPGLQGGTYRPLSDRDVERIHHTALDVLENIGVAAPVPQIRELALDAGCSIDDGGRLHFPRALTEDVIATTGRNFILHGREPKHDVHVTGAAVHYATGGGAVTMLDIETGRYRPSTLIDLYDLARLADRLEHLHGLQQLVVATEIADLFVHDVNTAYASLAGTTKSVRMFFYNPVHVEAVAEMCDMIAGGEGRFRRKPFAAVVASSIVSPLRFGEDQSLLSISAARLGFPVVVAPAPQSGATAPAALAGTLVLALAETLAGLIQINLVAPGHPVLLALLPFVSDLRSGSFSGGCGEQAVVMAAGVQIANFYDLPCSVGAGMTDSKVPDNQAGYEKGLTTALTGLAGANMISQSSGTLSSLMGCSFEALVIDNDMLGSVMRAIRGIEVTDETLSYETIKDAVEGPGHFLGHPQTLALMESDFLYPEIGDRSSPEDWERAGRPDSRDHARKLAHEILSTHYPVHIDPKIDAAIRERFPIILPREDMCRESGRW